MMATASASTSRNTQAIQRPNPFLHPRKAFRYWAYKDRQPDMAPLILHRNRIYILPTRSGFVFGIMAFIMLMGSMNYSTSMGYALTFLLVGLSVVSILHAFKNLNGLQVQPGKATPVFAGEIARFEYFLVSPFQTIRESVGINDVEGRLNDIGDVPRVGSLTLTQKIKTSKRGRLRAGRFSIFSAFPLGLFRAWSWVEFRNEVLVYPAPETDPPPLPYGDSAELFGADKGDGNEDFRGLRTYHRGDHPRHIAWKALAKQQGLLTKQFVGKAAAQVWVDWQAAGNLDTEPRLSRLCRWIVEAEKLGLEYGLRIPGCEIIPATGENHRQACLRALALFEHERA